MLEYALTKSQTFQLSYWNVYCEFQGERRKYDDNRNRYYDVRVNRRYAEFKELSIAIIDPNRNSKKGVVIFTAPYLFCL